MSAVDERMEIRSPTRSLLPASRLSVVHALPCQVDANVEMSEDAEDQPDHARLSRLSLISGLVPKLDFSKLRGRPRPTVVVPVITAALSVELEGRSDEVVAQASASMPPGASSTKAIPAPQPAPIVSGIKVLGEKMLFLKTPSHLNRFGSRSTSPISKSPTKMKMHKPSCLGNAVRQQLAAAEKDATRGNGLDQMDFLARLERVEQMEAQRTARVELVEAQRTARVELVETQRTARATTLGAGDFLPNFLTTHATYVTPGSTPLSNTTTGAFVADKSRPPSPVRVFAAAKSRSHSPSKPSRAGSPSRASPGKGKKTGRGKMVKASPMRPPVGRAGKSS